jgi:predicted nucleic acid-binding protein
VSTGVFAVHGFADFADALHLALSQGEEAVMTFDKAFARQTTRLALAPPVRTA